MEGKLHRWDFPVAACHLVPSSKPFHRQHTGSNTRLHPRWNLILKLEAGTSELRVPHRESPPCSSLYVRVRAWESTQILMETLREKRGKQPGAWGGDTTYLPEDKPWLKRQLLLGWGTRGCPTPRGCTAHLEEPGRAGQGLKDTQKEVHW